MKLLVPCMTLDEAKARVQEDPDLSIDSIENKEEFSNYKMAVAIGLVDPSIQPYLVWKDLNP